MTAVMLACGRDFDDFGFGVAASVLLLSKTARLYLGIKRSNYDKSKKKSVLPAHRVRWMFEDESVRSSVPFYNAAYRAVTEEYVVLLVDDYVITGDVFGVLDFIRNLPQPIASIGVHSSSGEHDNAPSEIAYWPESVGHSGSPGAHPTYRAAHSFAAKMSFLRETFPEDLFLAHRYYADDLFAFTIQKKHDFVIPVWPGGALWATDEPPCDLPPGYSGLDAYHYYLGRVEELEPRPT